MHFWNWVRKRSVCGKVRKEMLGLFCANFETSQLPWPTCHSIWCGDCYTPHHLDQFFQFIPVDEARFDWRSQDDQLYCFCIARDGDHLVTPFQCNLCTFQNLAHCNPSGSAQDTFLLCCIQSANLDAI